MYLYYTAHGRPLTAAQMLIFTDDQDWGGANIWCSKISNINNSKRNSYYETNL